MPFFNYYSARFHIYKGDTFGVLVDGGKGPTRISWWWLIEKVDHQARAKT